jgi:hypothetical protein
MALCYLAYDAHVILRLQILVERGGACLLRRFAVQYVDTHGRFRGAYCVHYQVLIMEAV